MNREEDVRIRTVRDLTARLELLNRGSVCTLRRDLRVARAREDHPCSLRFEETLQLTADAQGYGLLHDARRSNRTRVTAAMPWVDGNDPSLHPRDRVDITMDPIRITRFVRIPLGL